MILNHALLYKRDSAGNVRAWRMQSEGPKHRTLAGLLDGAQTTSDWTVCVGKQKRTNDEQVLAAA